MTTNDSAQLAGLNVSKLETRGQERINLDAYLPSTGVSFRMEV